MKYALLSLIVLGLLASFACGGGASSSTEQPSTKSSESPVSPMSSESPAPSSRVTATSGLPPCQSATATNCDASGLQQSAGTHGSPGCNGQGTALIGASPIDLDEILYIQPMGLMVGGHVTPIDHGYFYIKGAFATPTRQAAVKSPFAGVITFVTRTARGGGPNGNYDDYAVTIEATCTFRIRFSNLVGFAGGLAAKVGELQPNQSVAPDYAVAEGELIGYTGLPTANGIDVWVENDEATLTGFVNPEQYAFESWKTHVVDLFEYTKEPLKSQLLALDMRDAAPRWGKIDYDIDGKLVGNWFRVDSGGYAGKQAGGEGYWDGHLAVVYDGNDPSQIVISFGNYGGQAQQFAVVGNTPDPATVSKATGIVAYELGQIVAYDGDTGQAWNGMSYVAHLKVRASTPATGTVLMQMVGERELRLEIFPGKSAAQVSGFDSGALTYER